MKERGQAAGIPYFNLQRIASSTVLSHRLVQYVTHQYGVTASELLYRELNERHFIEGKKLNDLNMLLDAATKSVGNEFDFKAARTYLQDKNAGLKELNNVQKLLNKLGIHSIPAFVIGGDCNFIVDGAATSSTFVNIFRGIEESSPSGAPKSFFGETLGFSRRVLEDVVVL